MRGRERLSIQSRLRIAILSLVTAIVLALSVLHLNGVIGGTFQDVGERSRMVSEQVNAYLLESASRYTAGRTPANLDESKQLWYAGVRGDEGLRRMLQRSLSQVSSIVDVAVLNDRQSVLNAADASRIGMTDTGAEPWKDWQERGAFWRLADVFRSDRDLRLDSPLGIPGSQQEVMRIRVTLSPVLLRKAVEPKIHDLAAVSIVSLAFSALLAIVVSNLVGSSLERLGQKIDLIAKGDLKSVQQDRFDAPEFADLETKLWWLGRQYTGAKADIVHLRSNVEQMLRNLDEALFVFGPDGRLQMAGEPAERLLARRREDLQGRSLDEVFQEWTQVGSVLAEAIASRKTLRDKPVSLERPNLPTLRLLLSVEPIQYEDGSATGTLVALRDVETRQEIRTHLDTARRLAAISRITSGVAHEIKNPLNAMMLHLEIARAKMQSGGDASPELDIVTQELLRLDRVVKALLDFNKPVDVQMIECDLGVLAKEVAQLIKPQADAFGIELELDAGSKQSSVMADPDLLKQGILNVATNGLEAMGHGGNIRICVEQGANEHALAVYDSGPGIPADIRDKIFNLYFTTKQSGTGVGLAMTYRIMQLHNGSVGVESEMGKGTCVRLYLPAQEPREAAA